MDGIKIAPQTLIPPEVNLVTSLNHLLRIFNTASNRSDNPILAEANLAMQEIIRALRKMGFKVVQNYDRYDYRLEQKEKGV